MNRLINNIDEKWFEDIVMFSISNPNENVSSGEIRVLTRNGVFFMSAYNNPQSSYNKSQKRINDVDEHSESNSVKDSCIFIENLNLVEMLGIESERMVNIAEEYTCLDCGCNNHLFIKNEYYPVVSKVLEDMGENKNLWNLRISQIIDKLNTEE